MQPILLPFATEVTPQEPALGMCIFINPHHILVASLKDDKSIGA